LMRNLSQFGLTGIALPFETGSKCRLDGFGLFADSFHDYRSLPEFAVDSLSSASSAG
jgi:hypothetical protein